jgi:hypothetical protein
MSDFTDHDVTEAMIKFGGGFVQQLGQLYRRGDSDNRKRLLAAFPEYWQTYKRIAIEHLEEKQKVD